MNKLFFLLLFPFFVIDVKAQEPAMVFVEGGSFIMGSNIQSNEQPTHSVTVSSFKMSNYEITVAEYKAYCKATGSDMPKPPKKIYTDPTWSLSDLYTIWNDKHPMTNIDFDGVTAYCNWLSRTTGKKYRLPTEAEWEFAARGGNRSRGYTYAGSDRLEEVGWSSDDASLYDHACGLKKPNELGCTI